MGAGRSLQFCGKNELLKDDSSWIVEWNRGPENCESSRCRAGWNLTPSLPPPCLPPHPNLRIMSHQDAGQGRT